MRLTQRRAASQPGPDLLPRLVRLGVIQVVGGVLLMIGCWAGNELVQAREWREFILGAGLAVSACVLANGMVQVARWPRRLRALRSAGWRRGRAMIEHTLTGRYVLDVTGVQEPSLITLSRPDGRLKSRLGGLGALDVWIGGTGQALTVALDSDRPLVVAARPYGKSQIRRNRLFGVVTAAAGAVLLVPFLIMLGSYEFTSTDDPVLWLTFLDLVACVGCGIGAICLFLRRG